RPTRRHGTTPACLVTADVTRPTITPYKSTAITIDEKSGLEKWGTHEKCDITGDIALRTHTHQSRQVRK
ncbi:hypothetical protein ABH105_29020, partial [Mycolicibacterium smegmatis]